VTTQASAPERRPRALRPSGKALPADARAHNRALVLQSLFRAGPYSRADLARMTGLTRVTVSDLVTDLLADGLVDELGPRTESRIGKPATLVALKRDAADVVAISLSDDQALTGALLDLAGTVHRRASLPREARTGEAAVEAVTQLARTLVADATHPVLGVGIGSPGVVDPAGTVLAAPNMGWSDVRLAERLAADLALPVHVANDANTAALAEHTFGGADDGGTLVLTVGQGVGAGLLLDGALVQGRRFAAGEIGHVVVDESGPLCACGRRGCLETFLAVPLLRRSLAATPDDAARVLTDAGERLGLALAPVVSTLNLSLVVLNGPADLLAGPLLDAAVAAVRRRIMPVVGDHLEVRLSALPEDAVLLGAASLVLSRQLGVA